MFIVHIYYVFICVYLDSLLSTKMAQSKSSQDLDLRDLSVTKYISISSNELGKGSYGTVYAALLGSTKCVAKELHPHFQKVNESQINSPQNNFVEECRILSKLRHPNIVQFFGVYYKDKSHVPILIMERLWENLHTLLEQRQNQISFLIKTRILCDVACGLEYMHSQETPVIHRDINTTNIMLTKHLEAKIIDLGQAKILGSIDRERLTTAPGTVVYMAPETLMSKPHYDAKVDIFSFGCVIVHVVTEKIPIPTDQFSIHGGKSGVYLKVSEFDRRKEFFDLMGSSSSLKKIACQCLEDVPSERPTASCLCGDLEEYIDHLETQSTTLTEGQKKEQFKQAELEGIVAEKAAIVADLNEKLVQADTRLKFEIANSQDRERALLKAVKDIQLARQSEKGTKQLSVLLQSVSELQSAYEKQYQLVNQRVSLYVKSFNEQCEKVVALNNELSKLRKEFNLQKDQLEEKFNYLAALEFSCIISEELYSKETGLEEENATLRKILENNDRVLSNYEKDLRNKAEILKRKDEEIELQEEEIERLHSHHKNAIEESKEIQVCKSKLPDKQEISSLLEKVIQCRTESFGGKDDDSKINVYHKYKALEKENNILKKLLEKYDRMQRNLEKDFKDKENLQKENEKEWKRLHDDDMCSLREKYRLKINNLLMQIQQHDTQMTNQEENFSLLKQIEDMYKSDRKRNTTDRHKKLEVIHAKEVELLKRQIKHKDTDIKEKKKYIASLERHFYNDHDSQHIYGLHWYPYLSLPVKMIRPSVAIIKEKVYVIGGYQLTSPQERKLEDYLQTLEGKGSVFCFQLAKCHCNTMTSPVVLGALASVNGQCVLVSGADSVGNTLTGNVYVLCEEESHDQWKEFSKPLPTPRILANACCYGNRWLIVCGGFTIKPPKEESCLLEAVNAVEILNITKGEWYPLPEEKCPSFSTILCCAVVGEEVYVVGSDQVIKTSCYMMIKAATSNDTLVWDNVQITTKDSNVKLHPFSVVGVNGKPKIIASMTDGEDDVTCVLMKKTGGRCKIMSKAVECQHCSAAVVTSSLELLLFGGSKKILVDEATRISQKAILLPTLNIQS